MEAKELRLGNLVMYDGKVSKIWGITEGYPFLNTDMYGHGIVTYRNIEPILLIEEWLLKFGFEQEKGIMSYVKPDYADVKIVYETIADFYRLYPYTYKLKYVHQLQNLYLDLVGIELEIKE